MEKKEKNNTTEYGEWVCTEHHWLPIEKQKEQANRLSKVTKRKNNN